MSSDGDDRFEELLAECHNAIVLSHTSSQPSWSVDFDAGTVARLERGMRGLELLEHYRRSRDSLEASAGAHSLPPDTVANGHGNTLPLKQLGRFRIERELGRGGHGIVFLAFDEMLQRHVALKVPRPECLISHQMRHRFLREAQAAARLTHPHLLAIYESGEDGPFCYLASTYCTGPTVSQWLKRQTKPVPEKLAASIVAALADGVAYANERGVLHRDIKPSNVFLDGSAQGFVPVVPDTTDEASSHNAPFLMCVPKLGDFGLARMADEVSDTTRTGAVIGTPGYMAPEQARGAVDQIGPATDVYGLGVVLFELLAGRPAFRGPNDVDTLRQIVSDEAPSLRRFRPDASLDLAAICRVCLEKDPAHRYASGSALAADLGRYLNGEPTRARPLSAPERVRKWVRRNPEWAMTLGLAAAASLVFVTLLTRANFQWKHERDRAIVQEQLAETRRVEAEAAELQARRQQYAASMQLAAGAIDAGQRRSAVGTLRRLIPTANQADVRDAAWSYLWRQIFGYEHELVGHDGPLSAIAYSPNGELLATGSWDGTIRIWNTADGSVRATLLGHQGHVNCLAFVEGSEHVLSGADDGVLKLWNNTGDLLETIPAHAGDLLCLSVSKDGTLWATGGADRLVQVWNASTHQHVAQLEGHTDWVRGVVFTNDNDRLITASDDKCLRFWSLSAATSDVVKQRNKAITLAISPDGRTVASNDGSQILLRDSSSGEELARWEATTGKIRSLGFSPDAGHLIVAQAGNALIVNIQRRSTERTILAQDEDLMCVAISPDGSRLACGGRDNRGEIWPLDSVAGGRLVAKVPRANPGISVARAGALIAVVHDRRLTVYERESGSLLHRISIPRPLFGALGPPVISPDGREVAVRTTSGTIVRFDLNTEAPLPTFVGHRGKVGEIAYNHESTILAATNEDGGLRIWDLKSGANIHEVQVPGRHQIGQLLFSPNGQFLIGSCYHNGTAYLWDTVNYRCVGSLQPGGSDLAVSSAGVLASRDREGAIQLWDLNDLRLIGSLASQSDTPGRIVFSPGGELLLASQPDTGRVEFWNIQTSQKLFAVDLHHISVPEFSADGTNLYVLGENLTGESIIAQIPISLAPWKAMAAQPAAAQMSAPPADTISVTQAAPPCEFLTSTVTLPLSPNVEAASCVFIQPDGRILVSGKSLHADSYDVILARFHGDGRLDRSFGNAGVAKVHVDGWTTNVYAQAYDDSSILVAAATAKDGDQRFLALRFDSSGSLDRSFGDSGQAVIKFEGPAYVEALAVDTMGRAVLVGCVTVGSGSRFALARLSRAGKLDPTFGDDGLVTTAFDVKAIAHSVAMDGDAIVVAGTSHDGHQEGMAIARYSQDGALDLSFAGDGKAVYPLSAQLVGANHLTLLPDGKMLYGALSVGTEWWMNIARLNRDGSRDSTFPLGGIDRVRVPTAKSNQRPNLIVQPDGKMLWMNEASDQHEGDDDIVLTRWHADGSPDQSFGELGAVFIRLGPRHERVRDAAVAPDGSIYVVGTYSSGTNNLHDIFLMRLTADGRPFPGFSERINQHVAPP